MVCAVDKYILFSNHCGPLLPFYLTGPQWYKDILLFNIWVEHLQDKSENQCNIWAKLLSLSQVHSYFVYKMGF
jgi:hypothetical protein